MIHKKLLGPTTLTALLVFILVFVFIRSWTIPFREVMNGVTALAIYGALILSYLLSAILIIIGLFAFYRVLWVRVSGQNHKQVEV